jgi:hypothetical protein
MKKRAEGAERRGGRRAKVESTVLELALVGGGGAVAMVHDCALLEGALDVLVIVEDNFLVSVRLLHGHIHWAAEIESGDR